MKVNGFGQRAMSLTLALVVGVMLMLAAAGTCRGAEQQSTQIAGSNASAPAWKDVRAVGVVVTQDYGAAKKFGGLPLRELAETTLALWGLQCRPPEGQAALLRLDLRGEPVGSEYMRVLSTVAPPGPVRLYTGAKLTLHGMFEIARVRCGEFTVSHEQPAALPIVRDESYTDPSSAPFRIVYSAAIRPAAFEACFGEMQRLRGDSQPLLMALGHRDKDVCRAAAKALRQLGPDWSLTPAARQAAPQFLAGLSRWQPDGRLMAAEALGKMRDPGAVAPLVRALGDETPLVRAAAAEALGRIGDPRALQPLVALLKDKEATARAGAAKALGMIADPGAVEGLLASVQDKDWVVLQAVAEALGNIRDPRAVEYLIPGLVYDNPLVRDAVAKALDKIDPRWPQHPAARQDVPYFVSMLASADGFVRRAAGETLAKIEPRWPQDPAAREAVPYIVSRLSDKSFVVRESAVEALGLICDVRAVEPLMAALRDENFAVREAAARALGNIGDQRAAQALTAAALNDEVFGVREAAREALKKISAVTPPAK